MQGKTQFCFHGSIAVVLYRFIYCKIGPAVSPLDSFCSAAVVPVLYCDAEGGREREKERQ